MTDQPSASPGQPEQSPKTPAAKTGGQTNPKNAERPTQPAGRWQGLLGRVIPSGKGLPRLATSTSDNMGLLKGLFLGAVFTAVFYEIFPLPFIQSQTVVAVFDNWVSELILAMALWSLFILYFKYQRHRVELEALRAFRHEDVRRVFAQGVYAKGVDDMLGSLAKSLDSIRRGGFFPTTIHRRITRVLNYVRGVPKKEGVNDLLDYQAGIDVKKLEASYAVLGVFIWAIPILGFIGTVLGIAGSVSEFSSFVQTAEGGGQFNTQMRAALGGVTGGLAVAFNTTFLALVLVIPVMLATSFLQKSEEELLLDIEEYCLEELMPHLHITPSHAEVGETFDQHLHRIMQLSDKWLGQMEPLISNLSLKAQMLAHQIGGVQPIIQGFTDALLPGEEPDAQENPPLKKKRTSPPLQAE
ncbi:MAG: MotA/TolQ/ExbB proton channel family protein [Deltaproteobacteria bacterium]|nr:MotA/TolQ/ExbB proton channel family protein [Deltaproteobacteria bacterium]